MLLRYGGPRFKNYVTHVREGKGKNRKRKKGISKEEIEFTKGMNLYLFRNYFPDGKVSKSFSQEMLVL